MWREAQPSRSELAAECYRPHRPAHDLAFPKLDRGKKIGYNGNVVTEEGVDAHGEQNADQATQQSARKRQPSLYECVHYELT